MNIIKNPILNIKNESKELPISLENVKNYLHVDFEEEDEIILNMVSTAIHNCETSISKTLTRKTYVYSLYDLKANVLILPYPTIQEIIKIEIINFKNETNSINPENYIIDFLGGIINFLHKPINFYRLDIEYIAQMANINNELIQGILMHIARMYEDKSGYATMPLNTFNIYKKYKLIKL